MRSPSRSTKTASWAGNSAAVEATRVEEGADGSEGWMIPPEGVKARVGPEDPVNLLDRGGERPLADDVVRVAEILDERMPPALHRGFEAERKEAAGRERRDARVEINLRPPDGFRVDGAVGTPPLEEEAERRRARRALDLEAQAHDGRENHLARRIDRDARDLAGGEDPRTAQHVRQVLRCGGVGYRVGHGSAVQ